MAGASSRDELIAMPALPPALPVTSCDTTGFATVFTDFLASGADSCLVVSIPVSDMDLDAAIAVIPWAEQAAAQRFLNAIDRLRFILGRAGLRCLLSHATKTKAADLVFQQNEYGKIYLPHSLHFNLSHSGNLVLIGLHRSVEIGVDVESIARVTDWPMLADHYLTQSERDLIGACAPAQKEIAFLRAWTRKEAVIKAVGLGLSLPLQSFAVVAAQAGLTIVAAAGALSNRDWSCHDLTLDSAHVGAVAFAASMSPCAGAATTFAALRHVAVL
jgi:4'-phosphopantetheinyl transferase